MLQPIRVTVLSLLFAAPAIAQVSVAVVSAEVSGCQTTDPVTKLEATGFFGTVDHIDVRSSTPGLQQLLAYDGLLVHSKGPSENKCQVSASHRRSWQGAPPTRIRWILGEGAT
ncbi:MAG: hypothetical protein GY711_11205 [bacterium]|nr:hypothetical protein [bacterium]